MIPSKIKSNLINPWSIPTEVLDLMEDAPDWIKIFFTCPTLFKVIYDNDN